VEALEKRNIMRLWVFGVLRTAATAFLSVLPAYFLRSGMNDMQISVYTTMTQAVNVAVSLICSGVAHGYNDCRRPLILMLTLQSVFTAGYGIFCAVHVSAGLFYAAVLVICSLLAAVSAFITIFYYKQPYQVMRVDSYAMMVSYSTVFNGIVGVGIGFILPLLFKKYDFMLITGLSIAAASLCLFFAALVQIKLRPLDENGGLPTSPRRITIDPIRDMRSLVKDRDFMVMLIPNFARGVGSGLFSLIAVMAIRHMGMADGDIPLITSAGNIGVILSGVLYVRLVRRFGITATGLAGGIIAAAACISMESSIPVFLVIYCITYIGKGFVDNAVPNSVYKCTDPAIISQFHTWRLAVTSLGSAVGVMGYGYLMDKLSPLMLFGISSACTLICMVGYYLNYDKRMKKQN